MTRLKRGQEFLPNVPQGELRKLYDKERNAKAKLRLLAAIQRKRGRTLDDIAYVLDKPKTTIHDWLKRFADGTVDRRYDVKQPGKPPKLTKMQLAELEAILAASPQEQGLPFVLWTTKLVQYIVIKLFNVKYEFWNIGKLTRRLGFTLQVPRQRNRKADARKQEEFKKNLKRRYNITLNLDSRSSVLMKRISS